MYAGARLPDLSAALNESLTQNNAWMLTLSERFDLNSGACLAPDLAESERPRVHVCRAADLLAPTPRPRQAALWEPLPS